MKNEIAPKIVDMDLFAKFVDILQRLNSYETRINAISKFILNINADYKFQTSLSDISVDVLMDFLDKITDKSFNNIIIKTNTETTYWNDEFPYNVYELPDYNILLNTDIGDTVISGDISYIAHAILEMLNQKTKGTLLLRCPLCKKIFVNITLRHMRFCSKKCRSHYGMKKLRGQLCERKKRIV